MRDLFTSPKFLTISIAIIALIIIPLTLIEVQSQQTIQQHAATNSPCPGYNGDSNAVIWCGSYDNGISTVRQIVNKYNNGDGHNSAKSIQNIYSYSLFHISSTNIKNLGTYEKVGTVTKNGDVILNGKVIATNAITAGRQYITGSTKHTNNGTVFYTRSTKISFLNNSLKAYIVMRNGKFLFAILQSCGNPISATPKNIPTPTPTPTKKPTPTVSPGQPTPTPTVCPTLAPVQDVHIVCPNCQLSPTPIQ